MLLLDVRGDVILIGGGRGGDNTVYDEIGDGKSGCWCVGKFSGDTLAFGRPPRSGRVEL